MRQVFRMFACLVGIAFSLQGRAEAQSNATEIKGLGNYVLGMTLREFENIAAQAVKTSKADKHHCYKRSYETKCSITNLGKDGPPLSFVNFEFSQTDEKQEEHDRRLSTIWVNEYKSVAFDKLEPLFVVKYGPPDHTKVEKMKSAAGVEYESRAENWVRGTAAIFLNERRGEGKVNQMGIVILTTEYSSYAEEMKKQELTNRGKKL